MTLRIQVNRKGRRRRRTRRKRSRRRARRIRNTKSIRNERKNQKKRYSFPQSCPKFILFNLCDLFQTSDDDHATKLRLEAILSMKKKGSKRSQESEASSE
jgi:hypothetical protein